MPQKHTEFGTRKNYSQTPPQPNNQTNKTNQTQPQTKNWIQTKPQTKPEPNDQPFIRSFFRDDGFTVSWIPGVAYERHVQAGGRRIEGTWGTQNHQKPCFSPNSVSTLWGSYGRSKEWCPWGVLLPLLVSTAQARTEFRLRRQCAVDLWARDFGSFYRVSVHFLKQNVVLRDRCRRSDGFGGSKREFTWQVQGIGHIVKIVAGAVFWTWPKRWQACVIRRIAFYVAGTGNTHHGSYILRSKGSIPEKGCIFGIWTWGSVCVASAAFRMTSGHDFVARAVLLKHVSIFVEVSHKTLVLELRIFSFRGSLAQNARFGAPELQFSRKSRTKRSFWSSGASVFEEVSHKTLVLELRSFSFRGSLAQNARFGAPELQFSRKSRTKRSFWKSGSSVFEEVSHKTLVLEVRSFSFRGSLAEFARLQYLDASGPKLDPNTEILRQRSCRSGPTGSW